MKLKWEKKTQFAINERMLEVLRLTKEVAEKQIVNYQRKLEKLTYGS